MESTLLLVARQRVCHQSTQLPKHPADWPATMWSPARSTFLWKTCHKSYLGRIWQFWSIMHGSTSAFLQDNTCSSTAARTQAAEWRYKSHNVTWICCFLKTQNTKQEICKKVSMHRGRDSIQVKICWQVNYGRCHSTGRHICAVSLDPPFWTKCTFLHFEEILRKLES